MGCRSLYPTINKLWLLQIDLRLATPMATDKLVDNVSLCEHNDNEGSHNNGLIGIDKWWKLDVEGN